MFKNCSFQAAMIFGAPMLAWATVLFLRRMKSRDVKRQLKDTTPFIYHELEAAMTSLKSNNLYASAGKKATVSR